jgi:phage-related protein
VLSPVVKVEKNKLTIDSVFIALLEITIPSVTDVIRIANNNDDVVWNGYIWQKFPFELGEVSESSNAETSQFQIKVSNVNNLIGQYVRQYDVYIKENGYSPINITLYLVNSRDLDNTTPVFSHNLILSTPSINMQEVSFTVSARDLFRAKTPIHKMLPNNCRFKFKSLLCGYAGAETTCDKTLLRCRELNNSARYGGFPTIGNKGVSV